MLAWSMLTVQTPWSSVAGLILPQKPKISQAAKKCETKQRHWRFDDREVVERCKDLEVVLHAEVRQKGRNQSGELSHPPVLSA